MRSFDEISGNVFERRVNRKKCEWRVDVREGEDYRERAIEEEFDGMMRDVEILQEAVEHAIASKDCFPSVTAHKITGPQRDNHELVEKIFSFWCVKREEISEWVSENQREQGNGGGDANRSKKDREVNRVANQLDVILKIPVVNDGLLRRNRPEAVAEEKRVGKKEECGDPDQRRDRDGRFIGTGVHG